MITGNNEKKFNIPQALYIVIFTLLFVLISPCVLSTGNEAGKTSMQTESLDFPVTQITKNIHVIYGPFSLPDKKNRGFRNNPVIIFTSKGVVVCDPGGSASAGQMVVTKVKAMTDQPIVAVFDSHAHGDHWLGNEAIKDAYPDVVIYGHAKMKSKVNSGDGELWLDLINRLTKHTAYGTRVVGPDKTVAHGEIISIGDTTFRIHHTGTAHTKGDIMVEIVEEDALFMGDIVRNEFLGVMEEDSSFKGNINAIDYILKHKGGMKYYIPGHGRVGGTDMIKKYRTYLSTLYDNVKSMYSSGMADYEMKSKVVKNLSPFKSWEGFEMRVGPHISQAYLEVENDEF